MIKTGIIAVRDHRRGRHEMHIVRGLAVHKHAPKRVLGPYTLLRLRISRLSTNLLSSHLAHTSHLDHYLVLIDSIFSPFLASSPRYHSVHLRMPSSSETIGSYPSSLLAFSMS